MQTGRIKIVLYVDGRWAYSYPTSDLRHKLGEVAHEALRMAYDRLDPIKISCCWMVSANLIANPNWTAHRGSCIS